MVWAWSHAQSAYDDVRENVFRRDRTWLETVYAEWQGKTGRGDHVVLDSKKYDRELKRAKTLPDDVLAETISDRMAEQRLCENGGYLAWACPFGCGSHLVPFDSETEAELELRVEEDDDAD